MTIASVFWARKATTGAHERLLYLLRGLADREHDVLLFTKQGYTFGTRRIETLELKEGRIPSSKFDALRALYLNGVQQVIDSGYDTPDAIVAFGLGNAVPSLCVKHYLDVPMLLGLRSYPPDNVVEKGRISEAVRRAITTLYLRVVLQGADRVIMQTETQEKKLVQNHPVQWKETAVIRNNIRGSLEKGTDSRRARRLLFVGTLNYRKGLDTLLQALPLIIASAESVHLDVAGKGPMKETAMSYVEENNLRDHVTFHGYVEDVKALMREADLLVIPSRFDSFPNVGLEAMELGTPFITSDLEDLRSAFGNAAQYVPPDDPEQLAATIGTLQQPGRYRSLREQCLLHRKKYSFDWVERFESEIERMAQGKS